MFQVKYFESTYIQLMNMKHRFIMQETIYSKTNACKRKPLRAMPFHRWLRITLQHLTVIWNLSGIFPWSVYFPWVVPARNVSLCNNVRYLYMCLYSYALISCQKRRKSNELQCVVQIKQTSWIKENYDLNCLWNTLAERILHTECYTEEHAFFSWLTTSLLSKLSVCILVSFPSLRI